MDGQIGWFLLQLDILPTSVMGWVGFALSLLAVAGHLVNHGKFVESARQTGIRVGEVENKVSSIEGRVYEITRVADRLDQVVNYRAKDLDRAIQEMDDTRRSIESNFKSLEKKLSDIDKRVYLYMRGQNGDT